MTLTVAWEPMSLISHPDAGLIQHIGADEHGSERMRWRFRNGLIASIIRGPISMGQFEFAILGHGGHAANVRRFGTAAQGRDLLDQLAAMPRGPVLMVGNTLLHRTAMRRRHHHELSVWRNDNWLAVTLGGLWITLLPYRDRRQERTLMRVFARAYSDRRRVDEEFRNADTAGWDVLASAAESLLYQMRQVH